LRASGGGCAALCAALSSFPATYEAVPRYDGAVIQWGRRERIDPCVVQPCDVSLVADVRRYKFLTAPRLRELWWPDRSVQATDRRLLKLFCAGAGTEVTQDVADVLAEEAERGYDLTAARRRRVGRPSLGARGTSPRVSFRPTPELYRAAQRQARKEGRTLSDLAREAVARYIRA
jgi:hypothetical protein